MEDNTFNEWDERWELTESAYALLDLLDKVKQDADV